MTEGFRSEIRESDGSLEATARVVDAGGDDDERIVEAALRPKRLAEFPGQPRVRDQLGLVLQAASSEAALLITCCSPDLRDWARRRWR